MKSVKLNVVFAVFAALALLFSMAPGRAQAYGNTAIWQIGLSGNCDNASLCGQDLGGFWGWIEFDQGGLGEATVAGCGHLTAAGPVQQAGAGYENIDITGWTVSGGQFVITSGTIYFQGKGAPPPEQITVPFPTGVPAAAGHYNTVDLLGFSAPGVSFQMQVTQIPNR